MSWPSGDDASMSDTGQNNELGRPTDLHALAVFKGNRIAGITRQNIENAWKLPSAPFESFPQLPVFAPLFGHTAEWQRQDVARRLVEASAVLGRVLTPPEADAIAYHRSRACARTAWVPPLVLLGAGYMTHRGRATFRFPFYTPKPASFNPLSFPSASKVFLGGAAATRLWHVLRFGAYWFVARYTIGAAITSFAGTSYMVHVVRDDRLVEFRDKLMGMAEQRRAKRDAPMPAQLPAAGAADSAEAAPFDQAMGTRPAHQEEPQGQQQQAAQQQAQWARPVSESRGAAQDDDAFLFDDASPVAPTQRQEPQAPGSPPSPGGGSAWDRVRQRAKSEEGAQWNQPQQPNGGSAGQRGTEQYTFAPAEQEKAYAKEQAQKEFDAMLERERRGTGESGERR